MVANADTPDGYHVDENGVWDGKAATVTNQKNLGPVSYTHLDVYKRQTLDLA